MARGRLTVVLAMVLSFGLGSPRPALAGPDDRAEPSDKPRKHRRPRDKGVSRYVLFAADAETFRKIETQDMVEVARQMYALAPASVAAVKAVVDEIQDARWEVGEEAEAYGALLTTRAKLCGKLIDSKELEAGGPGVYRQLLKNKEFSKIQRKIRSFERRHPHRFADYTDQLESVLDRDTVQAAHQDWHRRGKLVSRDIQVRGLLAGLMVGPGGKRAKGWDAKNQASKPRLRPKVKPRAQEPSAREEEKKTVSKTRRRAKAKPAAPKKSSRKTSAKTDKKAAKPNKAKPKKVDRKKLEAPQRARPLNEWERFVRDFIQRHDLTDAQRHAALSILRDLTFRAGQIERSIQPRLAEANGIADKKARKQRIATLNRPLDDLFHQLQKRLDSLLTAGQRNKAAPLRRRNSGPPRTAGDCLSPGGAQARSPRRKPWDHGASESNSPGGAKETTGATLSPLPGLNEHQRDTHPRLAPWATRLRPSGAGSSAAIPR